MSLKSRTEQVVEVSDWDDLVIKTYGRPYSFQQQDDCKPRGTYSLTVPSTWVDDYENESIPEVVNHPDMGVSFAAWLARDPKQRIPKEEDDSNDYTEMWYERNFYPNIEMIANDLHAKGLLEAGNYLINIDW